MSKQKGLENSVRERRGSLGWSQEELARRSGLSRAGISAIESGRLVPSTSAALSLAAALECRVEDLFRFPGPERVGPQWAWDPGREPCRFWVAEVEGADRSYPAEATPMGVVTHDGVYRQGVSRVLERTDPRRTLVMACCDPAVGLLAAELAHTAGVRLIALERSSRMALDLLGRGLVHVAGIHLSRADQSRGNTRVVRAELGAGYSLLRVARWEEGIVFAAGRGLPSVQAAVRSSLRWIGREDGSGAKQCLDELLGERPAVPRHIASGHRGVAEAIRSGWADAGICLRLVGEEAGLDFLGVREEAYDLCFPTRWEEDLRLRALLDVVRSRSYRGAIGDLPGYDSRETGESESIT
jgi:molybdate-binding protein/DNA-binding XRE family transcriptional regulator